jgi:hypothetical protein
VNPGTGAVSYEDQRRRGPEPVQAVLRVISAPSSGGRAIM